MVTLADAIEVLHPTAVPLVDYEVRDDGKGQFVHTWNLLVPPPTAEQVAAVTQSQVDAARTARRRGEATTAALSAADGTAVANRAAESVGATRDNDLAEVLKALCDLLGVTAEQLVDRVTLNREKTPPPYGAPTPAESVGAALTRLDGPTIFGLNAYYIAVGAGDPIQ